MGFIMKHFKLSVAISAVAALCTAPLMQARVHRTGVTSVNTTRVRIINNTNQTFVAKNILCNQQQVKGGVLGYKLGDMKTKNFSNVTISPKSTKAVFLVDRDLPVGAFYGTVKKREMPYEEWGMDIVDRNNPTCKFGAVIRSSRGPMPGSLLGSSFEAVGKVARQTYYINAMAGTGATAMLTLFAVTVAGISGTIDVAAQTIGQLVSSIGVKLVGDPACATIGYEFKWQGGLYKNLYIIINPKTAPPIKRGMSREVKMARLRP